MLEKIGNRRVVCTFAYMSEYAISRGADPKTVLKAFCWNGRAYINQFKVQGKRYNERRYNCNNTGRRVFKHFINDRNLGM